MFGLFLATLLGAVLVVALWRGLFATCGSGGRAEVLMTGIGFAGAGLTSVAVVIVVELD